MSQAQLAPGEHKILKQLELGDASYGDLKAGTGLADSILSEYLRRLQRVLLISRGPERKYRLLAEGRDALRRSDDIAIVCKSGRLLQREIEPSEDYVSPRIFPIDVSIYVSPEVERVIEDNLEEMQAERAGRVGKDEPKQRLLVQVASDVSRIFEDLFYRRFTGMFDDWWVYRLQRMKPAERKSLLRRVHHLELPRGSGPHQRDQIERTLDEIDRMYMSRKLAESVSPPNLPSMMDFEAALVVSVSPAKLRRNAEKIKNRFAVHLLSFAFDSHYYAARILQEMAEAGIITQEQFAEYDHAKNRTTKAWALRKLYRIYYELAWGKKLPTEHVVTIRG
jgi:hypothetical protein